MSPLNQAIANHGGPARVAGILGVSVQRLCNWTERGVPTEMCAAIERATKGDVMRWHLRPHDWWQIWPELIGSRGAPAIPQREAA